MLIAQFLSAFVGGEVGNLIQQTGPVAKIVLLILLGFSLFSWAIILAKWSALKRARAQSGRFVRAFRKATRLQDVAAVAEQFKPSPLVGVFENAYDEYRRQGGTAPRLTAIQRATQIAASEEMTRLERRLPWLATTGAVIMKMMSSTRTTSTNGVTLISERVRPRGTSPIAMAYPLGSGRSMAFKNSSAKSSIRALNSRREWVNRL